MNNGSLLHVQLKSQSFELVCVLLKFCIPRLLAWSLIISKSRPGLGSFIPCIVILELVASQVRSQIHR